MLRANGVFQQPVTAAVASTTRQVHIHDLRSSCRRSLKPIRAGHQGLSALNNDRYPIYLLKPDIRSAARTVFAISIVMVIWPTPPGTGVM